MSSNIIPLTLTADFFAERANRFLDRRNYAKALYYFQRAGEMDPNNPSHFFNIAGALGQLGKFAESNKVLMNVMRKFGGAAECHYYLARNYIYMDLLEQAEEQACLYLRKEPRGRFASEAIEILEYVAVELDRPPLTNAALIDDEKTALHERARSLMEEGSFQQAEKILRKLLKQYPDFIAACNNLSLCYYYKGEIHKAKRMIDSVLSREPSNIHALCNLAILYYQQQKKEELRELLAGLRKIFPLQFDQAYKLAITLGALGEHAAAYQLFKKMSVYAWRIDFHLCHYCAVAAFNLGRYQEAKKYWKRVLREDPESPIASYYLELIDKGETDIQAPYYYQLPYHYQRSRRRADSMRLERDPFIRSSFLWALRHGDRETKLQVLQAFEWLGDREVIEALKEFVADPDQEEDLKRMAARFVLNTLGYAKEERLSIHWKSSWKEVVNNLREQLTADQKEQAERLWTEFIRARYPDAPIIRKPKAWAAALEYLVTRRSFKEIAMDYEVNVQTVKKNAETIRGAVKRRI